MNTTYVCDLHCVLSAILTLNRQPTKVRPRRCNPTLSVTLHQDPRILQDVQRALKLKARREARLGQYQTAARNSEEPSSSPLLNSVPPIHATPSPSPRKASMQSELDFGPSIDVSSTYIVPASLDNGITLDWSGFAFYERPERRWHLPTVKRKGKEKLPQVHTVVDQQERAHAGAVCFLQLFLG